jgi:hypothetical protein
MHDRCGTTLVDVLACGGPAGHGGGASVSPAERADLASYLESL